MLRFYVPIAVLGGVATLVACSGSDPVADNVANAAAREVDVVPADESAATPTNQLEEGDDEAANGADAATPAGKIPAALHGRWGMTPGDCTSTRGDNKGMMTVSADAVRFYEAQARPAPDAKTYTDSISGSFDFTGEGMTWKKYQVLELQKGKLVRTESDPMASYTYARCTS